ncbi:MAG: ATP synthase F1 subunit gamma [Deltaproteobacteria bacterium]|nr:ATP synthase F1 subunit gamma [Deltaproteobacteria bacterium]
MPTLKEVQTKIGSIKKTKQITKAMNMVAASRLRGARNAMEGFRPFAGKFAEVLGSLAEKAGEDASPLLTPRDEVKKIHLVLCTSDRGLCGGFNMNLIEKARKFMESKKEEGKEFIVTNFGKKGRDWSRKEGLQIKNEYLGVVGSDFGFNVATNAGRSLIDGFLAGDWDEVYVVWSNFLGMGKQVSTLQQILPIPPIEEEQKKDINAPFRAEHICEPSPDELLSEMLPRNVYIQIHSGLLETSTSEHAARMMAMDNATKACNDMVDELTLLYNKARQAAITADLMDIVGGAEALKG